MRDIKAVHIYFHREELEELRLLGARNDQSIRAVVRMIVRDFLIAQRHQVTITLQQDAVTWKTTTA